MTKKILKDFLVEVVHEYDDKTNKVICQEIKFCRKLQRKFPCEKLTLKIKLLQYLTKLKESKT